MSAVRILCFVVYFTQTLELGAAVDDSVKCQWVASAIKKGCYWDVDENNKVLKWYRPPEKPSQESMCFCNPLVGGPGNYSRIELTEGPGQQSTSNGLCSGCVGVEEPVTDYSFSPDDPLSGQGSPTFGPCDGIKVYRCRCPTPTTPTTTTPIVKIPTTTIPKLSITSKPADVYLP